VPSRKKVRFREFWDDKEQLLSYSRDNDTIWMIIFATPNPTLLLLALSRFIVRKIVTCTYNFDTMPYWGMIMLSRLAAEHWQPNQLPLIDKLLSR
jgi:hypothetical protein